jgi:Carboxypeptidase regulatory-like domain
MTTFFGPILATALLGQLQGGPIQGTVVDEQRKPVAGASVVFFAPAPPEGNVDPVTVQTTTDAAGRFHLTSPPLGRQAMNGVNMWAHRPGSAITAAAARDRPPIDLVLREPAPRAVTVVGPDGLPVAGAIIAPRVISVADGGSVAELPAALTSSLAVTTGREGKAALDYLSASDQLVAVRITLALGDFVYIRNQVGQRSIGCGPYHGRADRLPGHNAGRIAAPRTSGRDDHD